MRLWRRIMPRFVVLEEAKEYSKLDRMDGLKESMERHPSTQEPRGWHDSHYYEEKYGRKPRS